MGPLGRGAPCEPWDLWKVFVLKSIRKRHQRRHLREKIFF